MAEYNNYFSGQYIDADDLNFDNESHRNELAERFNLVIDTPGIIGGHLDDLKVIPGSLPNSITILPGSAFTPEGKLINVIDDDANRINILFENSNGITYYIKAKYKELLLEPAFHPITGIGPDSDNPEIPYFTKISDYYEIDISPVEPDGTEVEIGRVIGSGAGNLVLSKLIDLSQRKFATVKNELLTNIDHNTLKNIGVLTHEQLEQRINQLFVDTGIIPSVDGSPSLSLPLSELIGNIFDHNHSGEGQGARIDHNSLINTHPDQHHKKIHKHSLDPGTADPDSDDGFVEKINLSDDGIEPIEVRGKLSGSFIKDDTILNSHISSIAEIDQEKIAKTGAIDNNFSGTPLNLEHEINQIRTYIKRAKFGLDPLKSFSDSQTPNISSLDQAITDKFDESTGHKHTGAVGDGPKLDNNSIIPKSLTSASIANNTITNELISNSAAIDESKLNLEGSYSWRNFVISGAGLSSFNGGVLNLSQPLVICDVLCDRRVNVITSAPLSVGSDEIIYVEWPEAHDDNIPLEIAVSDSQLTLTDRTVVLGHVNATDNKLYVKWAHNPYHRHTGTPGDYEQLDINNSTTGTLDDSRLSSNIAKITQVNSLIDAHNMSSAAHPDIRAFLEPSTTPFVQKAGDTMDGELIFPNNKKLTFKNPSNQSISLYRPNSTPASKAKFHLSLGDTASTLSEFHIGRGSFSTGRIILSADDGSVKADGNIISSSELEGTALSINTGIIKGTSNFRISETDNTQIKLNPLNEFTNGVRIEGVLDVDQIKLEDQIIEKDTVRNGVAFDNIVSAKDFYLTNLNQYASSLINQILQQAILFRKEDLSSQAGNTTVSLLDEPVSNSVTLNVNNNIILNEGVDYVVSSNQITFINASTKPTIADKIFVKYAINGGLGTGLSISGLSPSSGTTAGGTTVIIEGFGFDNVTSVEFGGVSASSFTINSPIQITAVTPAHTAGFVDVTISDGSNISTLINGFEFV